MGPGSGVTVLLDSVIVIDHLNRIPAARKYLRDVRPRAAISVVTRSEVLAGTEPEIRDEAAALLDYFPCLVVDVQVADLSAELRREYRCKLPDAFQVALARHHGLRLATRNTKDFPEAHFPFVVVPYRL